MSDPHSNFVAGGWVNTQSAGSRQPVEVLPRQSVVGGSEARTTREYELVGNTLFNSIQYSRILTDSSPCAVRPVGSSSRFCHARCRLAARAFFARLRRADTIIVPRLVSVIFTFLPKSKGRNGNGHNVDRIVPSYQLCRNDFISPCTRTTRVQPPTCITTAPAPASQGCQAGTHHHHITSHSCTSIISYRLLPPPPTSLLACVRST
jgi:hypothetical protein